MKLLNFGPGPAEFGPLIISSKFVSLCRLPTVMDDDAAVDNPDMIEVVALLGKIADDPYQYETHVAYISLLRKIGAGDDLREARQFFHSIFPFSEGAFLPFNCAELHRTVGSMA